MRSYLIALAVGLLVGVIYGLLRVRSPAPPVVALIGLLGMLIGEQIPSTVFHWTQAPDKVAEQPAASSEPRQP